MYIILKVWRDLSQYILLTYASFWRACGFNFGKKMWFGWIINGKHRHALTNTSEPTYHLRVLLLNIFQKAHLLEKEI